RANISLCKVMGFAVALPILLSCTVGPDYQRPTANVPTEFKELKGWKTADPSKADNGNPKRVLDSNWWE
ncbi:MAG: hypothetical protein LUO95_05295, partial [Methylococcaceae bacterium]|nr:hypothetical protein [Methylococcaceae bacterium]